MECQKHYWQTGTRTEIGEPCPYCCIAELEAELDTEANRTLGIINEQEATIHELEMMIYLYVDGADIAMEHNHIMRRVIENVQQRER